MAEEVDVTVKTDTSSIDDSLAKTGEAAKSVLDDFGLMDTGLGKMISGVTTFGSKAISVFKGVKGAIAATGIGLLIIAVASLVSYFTKTERGAQSLRKAMA